ncbi:MAG: hypothetical protein EWM50_04975 [Gottschalkiaceae bacterium]|nr:MAG: hypothetical protein EWM50_04975 [Gottschalkiaceae bacterium]
MNKIISDITKRILIVEGIEEVERIKFLYRNEKVHQIEVTQLALNKYQVEIIYKVGDYFRK